MKKILAYLAAFLIALMLVLLYLFGTWGTPGGNIFLKALGAN